MHQELSGFPATLAAGILVQILGLVLAAVVARRWRSAGYGVLFGVLTGLLPTLLLGAIAFLGYVVPWGQLTFWLMALWYRLVGG